MDEARKEDTLARRYLAAVAVVQWSCCRKMQLERGGLSWAEFRQMGETASSAIKDLKMYEPTRQHPVVLPHDLKQEFDFVYKLNENDAKAPSPAH